MARALVMLMMTLGLLSPEPGQAQFTPQGGSGGHWGGGRPGGGDREGMRVRAEALSAMNLEGMWGVLSFGLSLPADQLDSLRATFQANWDRRTSILADTSKETKESWEAIRDEFKSTRKDLDAVIKKTIGDEKFKELSKILKDREKLVHDQMGGGPDGGPGH